MMQLIIGIAIMSSAFDEPVLPSKVDRWISRSANLRALGTKNTTYKRVELSRFVNLVAKRLLDICISTFALLALSPILLMIAIAIKCDDKGSILFIQRRWGRDGRTFRVIKFRTMRMEVADVTGISQTRHDDPRVTRIGAMLRKRNLDELPQLLNVLLGDMSLVGPRCHVPGMLAAGVPYEMLVKDYHVRHTVRPGITGLAQLRGYRGPTDDEELARARFQSDLEYIETFHFWSDIKILFATLFKELRGGTGV